MQAFATKKEAETYFNDCLKMAAKLDLFSGVFLEYVAGEYFVTLQVNPMLFEIEVTELLGGDGVTVPTVFGSQYEGQKIVITKQDLQDMPEGDTRNTRKWSDIEAGVNEAGETHQK